MKIKVFIENEAGSNYKNIFDEKSLKHEKTVEVSRSYPYPYGFILNTTGEDGDNIDCFVLTDQHLKTGEIVECDPVGLMEQMESSDDLKREGLKDKDHNVLACFQEEKIVLNEHIKDTLRKFVGHVFDHILGKVVKVGDFYEADTARAYINEHKD